MLENSEFSSDAVKAWAKESKLNIEENEQKEIKLENEILSKDSAQMLEKYYETIGKEVLAQIIKDNENNNFNFSQSLVYKRCLAEIVEKYTFEEKEYFLKIAVSNHLPQFANVVIKSRYALLDLKCNKLEIRLKQFLKKIIQVVLNEINKADGTGYTMKDVWFDFNRETITNAQDNAQIELIDAQKQQIQINILMSVANVLGDELIIQNICEVLDLEYEEIKDKLPKADEDIGSVEAMLNNIVPDDLEGDVIE